MSIQARQLPIPCPHCSRSVNLIPYKRAIEEAVRMATEDDRFGKDDQIGRHWQSPPSQIGVKISRA